MKLFPSPTRSAFPKDRDHPPYGLSIRQWVFVKMVAAVESAGGDVTPEGTIDRAADLTCLVLEYEWEDGDD